MQLKDFFLRYEGSVIQLGWLLFSVVRISRELQVECIAPRSWGPTSAVLFLMKQETIRCLGTWLSGELGSARFTVRLDDLKGLFQPK